MVDFARRRVAASATVAVLLVTFARAAVAAPIQADSADDVCAPDADPCLVTSEIKVVDRSFLDFGTRQLQVTGGGQFDFGSGSGAIGCGDFLADTNVPSIEARGPTGFGYYGGGRVEILGQRACSAGPSPRSCVRDRDCDLGTCGARRCTGGASRLCQSDDECKTGPCISYRCANSAAVRRCTTNADCDFGSCSAQTTCSILGRVPVACAADSDCFFGSCSIGDASIRIEGEIAAYSERPGSLHFDATGDVELLGPVNLTSTVEGYGGDLSVVAGGSVVIESGVATTGSGSDGAGGNVTIAAGLDVALNGVVDLAGGTTPGEFKVEAGRDIRVTENVLATATALSPWGGWIELDAGRDIEFAGGSSQFPTRIDVSTFGGVDGQEGGWIDVFAQRNVTVGEHALLVANGSTYEGLAGEILLMAGGDLRLDGDLRAVSDGAEGSGGGLFVEAWGSLDVGPSARVFSLGADSTAGFASDGPLVFAGEVELAGSGASLAMQAGSSLQVSGRMTVRDRPGDRGPGEISVIGCEVSLSADAGIEQKAVTGETSIVARESLRSFAGSTVLAQDGVNRAIFRDLATPPVLLGSANPAFVLVHDPTLEPCPVCGNGDVESGESCDDGNTESGDGCTNACVSEACIAGTIEPGPPAVPLCDDGDACTEDACSPSAGGGECTNVPRSCDDGVACTADSCASGLCGHVPEDAACDDDNPCTSDSCSLEGCVATANNLPCDDGDECTGQDQCSDGACAGVDLGLCAVCGDDKVTAPEQCDDGDAIFVAGQHCDEACESVPCAHPTGSKGPLPIASDALHTLRTAVSQATCSLRVCDVDGNGTVLAADALRVLRAAIGVPIVMNCPLA